MLELIENNIFSIVLLILMVILIILYIQNVNKLSKLRKSYKEFMTRLGNSENIAENLKQYMDKVNKVEQDNVQIATYCKQLNIDMENCLQKVGMVRYNAFEDVGSDLSFAIAILDENNNGCIVNSVYARESSNIYAKPVVAGESKYVLSNEEKEALEIAVKNDKKPNK